MCHVRIGMPFPRSHSVVHQRCWLTWSQCRVGHDNLVGEVIRIDADKATIQVYEETGRQTPELLNMAHS